MLFDKNIYVARRNKLKSQIKSGLVLFFGNNGAPANYPANTYPHRQDSSFLYFYGLHREGLAGVIDVDNDKEYLIGDDIDIEDIVWFGAVDSVAGLAAQTGRAFAGWAVLRPPYISLSANPTPSKPAPVSRYAHTGAGPLEKRPEVSQASLPVPFRKPSHIEIYL